MTPGLTLEGTIALVTGATGGLGGAVVEDLAAAGARVVAVARRAYAPAAGPHAARIESIQGDLLDEAEVDRVVGEVVARHGRLDALVHLVGGFAMGERIAEMPTATWRRMLALNLDTAFFAGRAAARAMRPRRAGRLVFVGSWASVHPMPGAAAYAVSKAALAAFVENLAEETRGDGIAVNAILPKLIDTPDNRAAMGEAAAAGARPEEIAPVIRFLVGPDARLVSGALLPLYGRG